jgi:glycosyltransferase involved in cell wall biosynthesis
VRPERHGPGPKLLLAGPPCGRSGVEEAVAAVEALDGATLLVRPSADATEPATLLRHPAVRLATPAEIHELSGVDVVVAPAPCESYPAEVTLAAARGVPVVATRQAAGAVDLAHAGAEVQPHDAAGLCEAVRRILAERRSAPSRGLC